MAERKPLGLYEGAPGQFRPGDFLPISVGGTGADTAEGVRDALSIRRFLKEELIYVISSTGETGTLPVEPDTPVFRTIDEAMETIAFLDFNGFSLTLVFLEGEYEGNIAPYAVTNAVINLTTFSDNANQVVINGDGEGTLQAENGVKIIANRLTINNLWNSSLYAKGSGQIEAFDVYFGPGGSFVARVEKGGKILIDGEMQLTGGRSAFVYAEAGDVTVKCWPLTLVDNPAFDESFLYATDVSKISFAGEIVGTGQGRRYDISKNCIVMLPDGAGEDYFPLTIPGKNDGTCFYGRPISNLLVEDLTINVSVTTGEDSDPEIAGAYKTVAGALRKALTHDLNGYNVYIQLSDGVYVENIVMDRITNGNIFIIGNPANPELVTLQPNTGVGLSAVITDNNAVINLQDVYVQNVAASGSGLTAKNNSLIRGKNVYFGTNPFAAISAKTGGRVELTGKVNVSAVDTQCFIDVDEGFVDINCTVFETVPSIQYLTAFIVATNASLVKFFANIVTDNARGQRYNISKNSIIQIPSTADETYLPARLPGFNDGTGIVGKAVLSYRRQLLADTVFYVRPDGNDSNNGSTNTAANAFLTVQAAVNYICTLDLLDFQATIKIASGSYKQVTLKNTLGSKPVRIIGDAGSPETVFLTGSTANGPVNFCIGGIDCGTWKISGLNFSPFYDLQAGAYNNGIYAEGKSEIIIENACGFNEGFQSSVQIFVKNGATVTIDAPLLLRSGGHHFAQVDGYGSVLNYGTYGSNQIIETDLTYTRFMYVTNRGLVNAPELSYEIYAIVTGLKYYLTNGGIISTQDTGSWPGDKDGYIEGSESYFATPPVKRLVDTNVIYVNPSTSPQGVGTFNNPFNSISAAISKVKRIDTGYNDSVQIKLNPGTHTVSSALVLPYITGATKVVISGADLNASNTVVRFNSDLAEVESVFLATGTNGKWSLENFTLTTAGAGDGTVYGLTARAGSEILFKNINFGTGLSHHYRAIDGGVITPQEKYSISGGALTHMSATNNGTIHLTNVEVTITGAPEFTTVAVARTGGNITFDLCTFIGAVTGQKFIVDNGAIITSSTGRTDLLLPGTTAGSIATLGICDASFGAREKLTKPYTYFVRTDGNDNNNGFSNSMGGAFKTIQKAVDVASNLDNGSFDVTIMVFAGTYTDPVTLKSIVGNGRIIIRGFSENMVSTIVNIANNAAFDMGAGITGTYYFQYMRLLRSGTAGAMIQGNGGGGNILWDNINFTASAGGSHIQVGAGQTAVAMGNYTITGGGLTHLHAMDGGHIRVQNKTITITGTPGLTNGVATATRNGSIVLTGNAWSGATSGARYNASMCGTVFTGTGTQTTLPGSAKGVLATGGQYA